MTKRLCDAVAAYEQRVAPTGILFDHGEHGIPVEIDVYTLAILYNREGFTAVVRALIALASDPAHPATRDLIQGSFPEFIAAMNPWIPAPISIYDILTDDAFLLRFLGDNLVLPSGAETGWRRTWEWAFVGRGLSPGQLTSVFLDAARHGSLGLARILLAIRDAAGEPVIDVNGVPPAEIRMRTVMPRTTPLVLAILGGHTEFVRLLVEFNYVSNSETGFPVVFPVDLTTENPDEVDPLTAAVRTDNAEAFALIQEHWDDPWRPGKGLEFTDPIGFRFWGGDRALRSAVRNGKVAFAVALITWSRRVSATTIRFVIKMNPYRVNNAVTIFAAGYSEILRVFLDARRPEAYLVLRGLNNNSSDRAQEMARVALVAFEAHWVGNTLTWDQVSAIIEGAWSLGPVFLAFLFSQRWGQGTAKSYVFLETLPDVISEHDVRMQELGIDRLDQRGTFYTEVNTLDPVSETFEDDVIRAYYRAFPEDPDSESEDE